MEMIQNLSQLQKNNLRLRSDFQKRRKKRWLLQWMETSQSNVQCSQWQWWMTTWIGMLTSIALLRITTLLTTINQFRCNNKSFSNPQIWQPMTLQIWWACRMRCLKVPIKMRLRMVIPARHLSHLKPLVSEDWNQSLIDSLALMIWKESLMILRPSTTICSAEWRKPNEPKRTKSRKSYLDRCPKLQPIKKRRLSKT